MFKTLLISLLFSVNAFAADQFGVVCRNLDGQVRAQVHVVLPVKVFFHLGDKTSPNWIPQNQFDPVKFAAGAQVHAAGAKASHVQLHEERNYANSNDVSSYMAALWLFPDAEKKQKPLVIYLRDFLSVANAQNGNVIAGSVVVGHNSNDRMSVLYGEVLDFPANRQDMVLCRLVK